MGLDAQIAIVIPALNEAHTIVDLAERALAHSPNVIVVDDGSSDRTAELLSELPLTVLRHGTTQGKGASLMTGFREALKREVWAVATLDGDGQHRPEDLPKFLARAGEAKDRIIIGSRLADKAEFPPARYRANRFADFWISWASGHLIEDSQSGFRLYPRQVLETVSARADRHHGFVFESEILINAARKGHRCAAVSIPALYDGATKRKSHFRPVADILRIVHMVAGKLLSRWMYPQGLYQVFRVWRDKKP
jgi:glycosyltransferase involved in cell wall biosynthesis